MLDLALALWIGNVRRRAGYPTQAKFAEALGVSRGAVGNWETGRGKPTMAHAERFAAITNRTRAEVMARFGYPIGGGEPAAEALSPLPPEWLAAMRAEIAAGVADGLTAVLDQLRAEGLLPKPDTGADGPRRRRSA
ncbi:MAG: helix-turn-helix transcriptional regulator [Candidatus Limnocylindrales bacterium]